VALNFAVDGHQVHQFISELKTSSSYGGSRSWALGASSTRQSSARAVRMGARERLPSGVSRSYAFQAHASANYRNSIDAHARLMPALTQYVEAL
jgi:hypothetical protein